MPRSAARARRANSLAEIVPIAKHRAYYRQTKRKAAGCLNSAKSRKPSEVVVVGYDSAGDLFVLGVPPDPANAMWLLESAKAYLLRSGNGGS